MLISLMQAEAINCFMCVHVSFKQLCYLGELYKGKKYWETCWYFCLHFL